jgi:hypothetical protein
VVANAGGIEAIISGMDIHCEGCRAVTYSTAFVLKAGFSSQVSTVRYARLHLRSLL